MKALALVGLAFVAVGCAHGSTGTSAHLLGGQHAALALQGPTGVSAGQESVLEDALCQGLVQANHGDVSCPSATRAMLVLAQQRALVSGDASATDATYAAAMARVAHQVMASVSRDGSRWVLTLRYIAAPGAPPMATRVLRASTFDALVEGAPAAAQALLE